MNNFLQFDTSKNNIQNDSDYGNSTYRENGASSGVAPSIVHNKLFYQVSTMVSALGEALSAKGYTVSDEDIASLITVLGNIMTQADMPPYALTTAIEAWVIAYVASQIPTFDFSHSLAANGYQKFPVSTDGKQMIMQWGTYNTGTPLSEGSYSVTFPVPFSVICLNAQVTGLNVDSSLARDVAMQVVSTNTTGLIAYVQSMYVGTAKISGFSWFAIGY